MHDEKLTSHFYLSEFLHSETASRRGLSNQPEPFAAANLRAILAPGMQRVRDMLGTPVQVTSGYRSPAVNKAIGGARNSQHVQGLACDFVSPAFGTPKAVAAYLAQQQDALRFDQLISEGGWVHISFTEDEPRGEVLTAHFSSSGVTYTRGIA